MQIPKATDEESSVLETQRRLGIVVEGLRALSASLPPLPCLASLAQVKEFCVGLLENPSTHPWWEWSQTVPDSLHYSIAHSLFLFRKTIPTVFDEAQLSRDYIRKMCSPQPQPDPAFVRFIWEEVPRIFRTGWDRSYRGRSNFFLLPVSACIEAGRRRGGGRKLNRRLGFLRRCALGWETLPVSPLAKVNVVKEGCKARVVTVSSVDQTMLKPLHDTLYDHLAKQPWLLRGDAKAGLFSEFTEVEGETFVSGDYESATDNLSLTVYREVLRCLRSCSTMVPGSVWDTALQRSSSLLYTEGTFPRPQRRGQLMGNFLSFPILCLVNYLTFRFLVPRRSVPVKINGDDIVFRCRSDERERWFNGVGASGLVLSKGKTLVHRQVFTLNSALFRGTSFVKPLAYVRSKALFKKADSASALIGQYKSLTVAMSGAPRRFFQSYFLQRNRGLVILLQRSLTRALGLRVTDEVLRKSGLYRRERYYCRLEQEPGPPVCGVEGMTVAKPLGFASVNILRYKGKLQRELRLLEGSFHVACRLSAQGSLHKVTRDDWKRAAQDGTIPFYDGNRFSRKLMAKWRVPYGHWKKERVPTEMLMLPVEPGGGARRGLGYGPSVIQDL